MHVSIRLDTFVGTQLGDSRPSNYRGLISCTKAPLKIMWSAMGCWSGTLRMLLTILVGGTSIEVSLYIETT